MEKIQEVKDLRREIGLVFQFPEYQLFQDTIEKDIAFGPINLGELKSTSLQKVPGLLELVDLPANYLKRSPFDLSGGQKRRVAIAGIIALDGNTLVLDEPTGGLDPQGEEDFMRLFYKLNKEKGKRIIIVTHNMDHVLQIADQVVVMHKATTASSLVACTPTNYRGDDDYDSKVGLGIDRSEAIQDSNLDEMSDTNLGFTNFYTLGDSLSDYNGLSTVFTELLTKVINFVDIIDGDPKYEKMILNLLNQVLGPDGITIEVSIAKITITADNV
ncbi:hypothetical protein FQR65_LT16446 [Abscondita terminalis]|nr:hypothetical protein FQR65_LT16446 [Abscondita terminalis]